MEIVSIAILFGSLQGFLLALVFLFYKKELSNKVLGGVLISVSFALFLAFLQLYIDFQEYTYLIKTNFPLSLVFMPLLYLYLRLLIGPDDKLSVAHLLYFVPLLILLIYNTPFYFGSIEHKIDYYVRVEINGNPGLAESVEDIFLNGVALLFSVLIYVEARHYKKRAMNVFSDMDKAKTYWVFFLAISMLLLSGFAFTITVIQVISPGETTESINYLTAIGATLIIFFIAIEALINPQIFSHISTEIKVLVTKEKGDDEAEKVIKEAALYQNILNKINKLLVDEKIYRDPDLTLSKLSKEANIPAYLISKMIGAKLNTNFYTLINTFRLEEMKSKLTEQTDKGIMEMAYEAGFNAKSTFYDVFKKDTGLSPSQYIKQNK